MRKDAVNSPSPVSSIFKFIFDFGDFLSFHVSSLLSRFDLFFILIIFSLNKRRFLGIHSDNCVSMLRIINHCIILDSSLCIINTLLNVHPML
jgi:hypothetical protein